MFLLILLYHYLFWCHRQSTFSVSETEGSLALGLLNGGQNLSFPNFATEGIFYSLWSAPNFHGKRLDQSPSSLADNWSQDKPTNLPLLFWPVYGYAYDVLIGGLYPNQRPEWEYGLHGKTLELAVPITQANAVLKRVRQLFDQSAADGKAVTSTYRR